MIYPVSGAMRYGGIERLVYLISTGLQRKGHQVAVAAPEGSRFPEGIEHINTGVCGDFVNSEKVAYWGISYRLKEFEAILELSHTHWCMIENNLPGLAFIWHDPFIMKPLEPTYNICALSEWQRNRFRAVYGYDARVLDPHCGFALQPRPSNGRFIFIGKMGPQKGCLEAIKICRDLGVPLDIIGTPAIGDPPDYLERVRAEATGDIVYHGGVDDLTKNAMLVQSKALIYPINYPPGQGEAHSHKTVDTLLYGIPVVTYNTGAFSEVIEQGVTGFLANNEQEFKDAMTNVDKLDRQAIMEKAAKRWSIEATVDRLAHAAQEVARGERWGQRQVPVSIPSSGPIITKPEAPYAAGYVKYPERQYPRQVRLDTINACNARCTPCHLNFQTRPKGQMSLEMINKVLDDIKSWPTPLEEIVPVNFGEVFLLDNWFEILTLIASKLPGTKIALPTNGSKLGEKEVAQLCTIGTLKWLNFSVNGFFKETYESFMHLSADTVDKIKQVIIKVRAARPDITTCVSMVFDTRFQTEMERDLFVKFWQQYAHIVSINPAAYCNSPLGAPVIPVKTACRSVFDGLTVLYDGKVVTGCCFDSSGMLEVGDIEKETLLQIWRGEKIKRLWHLHNEGMRQDIELCGKCSFA
jgi:glycosyltransferase involved in cell wall biosynthesis